MFMVHDTLSNQRKMKKYIMPTYKIFSFFFKVMIFSPKKVYYAFTVQKVRKK
jgi:hypothetical protein